MLRIVETDKPIKDLPLESHEGIPVSQACPINFLPNMGLLATELQNIAAANYDRKVTSIRFTQHLPMQLFHPRYCTIEQIANNIELPMSSTPRGLAPTLRGLRDSMGKPPAVAYFELEFDVIHHGTDHAVQNAYAAVRELLVDRGVAKESWTNAQWYRLCWEAYAKFIESTLDAMGWRNTLWIASNAHDDDDGYHTDDFGNRVHAAFSPKNAPPRMISDLYVYPAGDQHDARAANFAATKPEGDMRVVHVTAGEVDGQKITPQQIHRRCLEATTRQAGIVIFVGNPDAPQGASGMPETSSKGACARWLLSQPGV